MNISYLLIRLALGVSLFGHGLVRLPKLRIFSQWMTNDFEKSILPKIAVVPFSYIVPISEFATGLLIILGLFTKPALVVAAFVIIMLMFGTTLLERWEYMPNQMIHILFITIVYYFIQHNQWALDNVIANVAR